MRLKLVLWLLLIILIAFGAKMIFVDAKEGSKECDDVFVSEIYSEYHQQRDAFIKHSLFYNEVMQGSSPLDLMMQKLLGLIAQPLRHHGTQQRSQHEEIVLLFREIATSPELTKSQGTASKNLLGELANWIFLRADLLDVFEAVLYRQISQPISEQSIFDYLTSRQQQMHSHLKALHKKHKSTNEDHFLAGNLPFGIEMEGMQLVRLAVPLIDNSYLPHWISSPVPSPEFTLFLEQQRSHLYVNLMRRHGTEKPLSTALESLEDSNPNLNVVTLDKDSDFYWQKGKFALDSMDASHFKGIFIEKLLDPNGNFFWSHELFLSNWQERLHSIVEEIQQKYFPNQVFLNRNERQDFIELSYLAILDAMVETLRPASMNISCRQSMDRGPSLMALWLWQKNRINDRQLVTMVLAPPLIIHQRTSHSPRIDRLVSAAKKLQYEVVEINSSKSGDHQLSNPAYQGLHR